MEKLNAAFCYIFSLSLGFFSGYHRNLLANENLIVENEWMLNVLKVGCSGLGFFPTFLLEEFF